MSASQHHPRAQSSESLAHGSRAVPQNMYFQQQRSHLVNEIAAALDSTLTHLNRLNRSLESVIGIGNEFSNVETLWSQFEGVMADAPESQQANAGASAKSKASEAQPEQESALDSPPVARMSRPR